MYQKIICCRICGNQNLIPILDLGMQALTGIFPYPNQKIDHAPLELLKCFGDDIRNCGLVQLKHTYDLNKMYGACYGYRSALNPSMVKHLKNIVNDIIELDLEINHKDLIIDIGSNDGTTLNNYPETNATLVGVDPTARYFKEQYKDNIAIVDDFFSSKKINTLFPGCKAKIITSFSMFYDLEDPLSFAREIVDLLDDNGMWILEQSYLPLMLKNNSFDTICHEHLEYYTLHQIMWIFKKVGLKIIDVSFNMVNGGSFRISAALLNSKHKQNDKKVNEILSQERLLELNTLKPYQEFNNKIENLKFDLLKTLNEIKLAGKSIYGLGASTKGNVLLQYYNIDNKLLTAIGEVNSEKFNKVTPGTNIPIENESEVMNCNPDYLLVLPWHFKSFFQENLKFKNTKLIFPLPTVEVTL